ncbi:hypothetical protein FHS63_005953 [Azospirillum doebereinerae]
MLCIVLAGWAEPWRRAGRLEETLDERLEERRAVRNDAPLEDVPGPRALVRGLARWAAGCHLAGSSPHQDRRWFRAAPLTK